MASPSTWGQRCSSSRELDSHARGLQFKFPAEDRLLLLWLYVNRVDSWSVYPARIRNLFTDHQKKTRRLGDMLTTHPPRIPWPIISTSLRVHPSGSTWPSLGFFSTLKVIKSTNSPTIETTNFGIHVPQMPCVLLRSVTLVTDIVIIICKHTPNFITIIHTFREDELLFNNIP